MSANEAFEMGVGNAASPKDVAAHVIAYATNGVMPVEVFREQVSNRGQGTSRAVAAPGGERVEVYAERVDGDTVRRLRRFQGGR